MPASRTEHQFIHSVHHNMLYRDSLFNEENSKEPASLKIQYELEKISGKFKVENDCGTKVTLVLPI